MELGRFLNMYQISIFWINIIYLAVVYGATRDANFPYDLMAESSDNIASKTADKTKGDDEKRTLSQQVAEGKYGLIHKEIFNKPIARPGVISYSSNNEVPNDTSSNYGGLNKSDIWLAENHLLVIKGGFYPLLETLPEYSRPVWAPIDDYNAPRRQVKIPNHPKVPPPFPVQLADGGPIQILGTNYSRNINATFIPSQYPISPLEGFEPGNGPFYPPGYPYPPDITPGKAPFSGPDDPSTIQGNNKAGPVNPHGSILPPFFDSLPPGSAILPPPNITDQNDEDDLSIYYPPPYSFYYPTDNTTNVPPGPLVPGIVLPPPPDFFGYLEKPTTTTTTTTTPKPTTTTTRAPHRTRPVNVTILRPVKTKPTAIYIYDNQIPHQPFAEYGPPPPNKISITTTKIPLRAYYTTSTKTGFIKTKKPEQQYYYYDPTAPETNSISGHYPNQYINNNNNTNYLLKPHFYYLPSRTNNFNTHIVDLEEKIRSYEKPPNKFQQHIYEKPVPKPVYQYSFEVSNYKEQHHKLLENPRPKYSVQIEQAIEITTPAPTYYNYQTPRTITNNHGYVSTSNPLYNNQYTKQDEKLYDDITKAYFTTFGKRIKATTPRPLAQQYSITKPRVNIETIKAINIQNQHYTSRPFTNENIQQPIRIPNQYQQNPYRTIQETQQYIRSKPVNSYLQQPPQVETFQAVTIPTDLQYLPIRQQKPISNQYLPNIETIDTISIPTRQNTVVNPYVHGRDTIESIRIEPNNKQGSFISYELPGDDGAHFYFLTPQLTQNGDSQRLGYFYQQPRSRRLSSRS